MAISLKLKGVEVFIKINGVGAKEYEGKGDDAKYEYPEKTVVRYIESVSEANYAIVNTVHPTYKHKHKHALNFAIQVDKTTLPITPLFVAKENIYKPLVSTTDGLDEVDALGRTSKKMFKFEKLQIVEINDKKRIKSDAKYAAHIGELKISVFKKQILSQAREEQYLMKGEARLEIAEKALKGRALSHGTSFQEAVATGEKLIFYETKPAKGDKKSVIVFIFKYASREMLQQLLVIPREPTPDILDNFSREELREMLRDRLLGNQERDDKMKIKREINDDWGSKRKFTNDDEIMTIDITGGEEVVTRVPKRRRTEESVDLTEE